MVTAWPQEKSTSAAPNLLFKCIRSPLFPVTKIYPLRCVVQDCLSNFDTLSFDISPGPSSSSFPLRHHTMVSKPDNYTVKIVAHRMPEQLSRTPERGGYWLPVSFSNEDQGLRTKSECPICRRKPRLARASKKLPGTTYRSSWHPDPRDPRQWY